MLAQQELRNRQGLYGTLHKILTALKALAYVETHRLQDRVSIQQHISDRMQQAFRQLRSHTQLAFTASLTPVQIVLGAERGFCGDINAQLLREAGHAAVDNGLQTILVGTRLIQQFETEPNGLIANVIAGLSGASVSEDCEYVVDALVALLQEHFELTATHLPQVDVVWISGTTGKITRLALFVGDDSPPETTRQTMMYCPAAALLRDLLPLCLFAQLQFSLSDALLQENKSRLQHLENAVNHLTDKRDALLLQSHRIRQAQIIADIEVLLGMSVT